MTYSASPELGVGKFGDRGWGMSAIAVSGFDECGDEFGCV